MKMRLVKIFIFTLALSLSGLWGVVSWAQPTAITIGTTPVTGGTADDCLYKTSDSKLGGHACPTFGANTWTGLQTFNGGVNTAPVAASVATNAITLNLAQGSFFNVTSTANVNAVTFNNAPAGATGFNVQITGDGTPWDWNWPSTVSWEGGTAPFIPSVPGRIIVLAFDRFSTDGQWIGKVKFRGDNGGPPALSSYKYFVNPSTGNDTNPCTGWETACESWLGLGAKYTLVAGDRVCIANSTELNETLTSKYSGALNAPIVVEGCGPGEPAVISNSATLQTASWSSAVGTTYSTVTSLIPPAPGGANPCFTWIDTGNGNAAKGICKGVRGTSSAVTFSGAVNVSTGSWAAGIATLTTSAVHNLQVGDTFTISGVSPTGYNVTATATTGTTGSTLKYAVASNPGSYSSGGNVASYYVNWVGVTAGQANAVVFSTTVALPTGLTAGVTYYITAPVTGRFQVSATQNGTAILLSGTNSGTQTGTSELGTYQYAFAGGSLYVNIGRAPTILDKFKIGQGTTTGISLNGVSHWRFSNLVSAYNGSYGVALNTGNLSATISIASPAVITSSGHGLIAGQLVTLSSTGTLPIPLTPGQKLYVVNPSTNTFSVALTPGGTAINTSGSQSGTQTVQTPVDDIVFANVAYRRNSSDGLNCFFGQCSDVIMTGVETSYHYPGGGGEGDGWSWHAPTNGYPSSFVFEYGVSAWNAKDGGDTTSSTNAVVRYSYFNNANAGYLYQYGGNAFGLGNSGAPSNGSLSFYGNIVAGDGSPFSLPGTAQNQFIAQGPFTDDNFVLKIYCNVFYAQTITNPNFRAVRLEAGNGVGSIFKNNIINGAQQIGEIVANSPVVGTTGNDYNVNTVSYSGITQPTNDLTSSPQFTSSTNFKLLTTSPAYQTGVVVPGLTRTSLVSRGVYGCTTPGTVFSP